MDYVEQNYQSLKAILETIQFLYTVKWFQVLLNDKNNLTSVIFWYIALAGDGVQ